MNIESAGRPSVQQYTPLAVTSFEQSSDQSGTQLQGLHDTGVQGLSGTRQTSPPSIQQQLLPHTQPLTTAYDHQIDQMSCMGFILTDVKLNRIPYSDRFAGSGLLDIGYDTPIAVWITNADFDDAVGYSTSVLRKGSVYISQPAELENIGLTLMSPIYRPTAKRQRSAAISRARQKVKIWQEICTCSNSKMRCLSRTK
jgi:hypothetical protein